MNDRTSVAPLSRMWQRLTPRFRIVLACMRRRKAKEDLSAVLAHELADAYNSGMASSSSDPSMRI